MELNGWLSISTLKKLCSNSNWDVNIINYAMNSLGLLCKFQFLKVFSKLLSIFLFFSDNESESVCFLPSINLFEIEFTKDPEINNETEVYFEFCQTFPRKSPKLTLKRQILKFCYFYFRWCILFVYSGATQIVINHCFPNDFKSFIYISN